MSTYIHHKLALCEKKAQGYRPLTSGALSTETVLQGATRQMILTGSNTKGWSWFVIQCDQRSEIVRHKLNHIVRPSIIATSADWPPSNFVRRHILLSLSQTFHTTAAYAMQESLDPMKSKEKATKIWVWFVYFNLCTPQGTRYETFQSAVSIHLFLELETSYGSASCQAPAQSQNRG